MKNRNELIYPLIFIGIISVISYPFLKDLIYPFWSYSEDLYVSDNKFEDADKFIKYGYPEIKEISIHFLTVVTSILIFSLTFSEKIVRFDTAKRHTKIVLIFGWCFLIISIILVAGGLALNTFALPVALSDVYYTQEGNVSIDFYNPAFKSLFVLLLGGYFFTLGISSIVLSGILSLVNQ